MSELDNIMENNDIVCLTCNGVDSDNCPACLSVRLSLLTNAANRLISRQWGERLSEEAVAAHHELQMDIAKWGFEEDDEVPAPKLDS